MSKVSRMKINSFGSIMVNRGESLKKQFCPFRKYVNPGTGKTESAFCEDACSLFGEPAVSDGIVTIKLCQGSFSCDAVNFSDERGA